MFHQVWRLSEPSDGNLGLACTVNGLVLGRTPLIERRDGRFVVRERSEIERLLSRAYRAELPLQQLMAGLANVAIALNANDPCLARIAAVHLRIPDLPNYVTRDEMEAVDVLIKSDSWNPALHPHAGAPPNPGWFATTEDAGAGASPVRTAQSDDPNQRSDTSSSAGNNWVRLRPAKRIDELGDFAEWLANATPEDEIAIRAEIKRYFEDVGWEAAAHDLNSKLSVVLRPGITPEVRQKILDSVDLYTRVDPAEYVGTRNFLNAVILAGTSLLATPSGPSLAWKLGWAKRGQMLHEQFGDEMFPPNYPDIDKIPDGIATSIKSIDLNARTYQNDMRLTNRVLRCVEDVQDFNGNDWGGKAVEFDDIKGRALQLIVPKGSMTKAQRVVVERVRARALQSEKPVNIIITEF
jgi:hypothetical protein